MIELFLVQCFRISLFVFHSEIKMDIALERHESTFFGELFLKSLTEKRFSGRLHGILK